MDTTSTARPSDVDSSASLRGWIAGYVAAQTRAIGTISATVVEEIVVLVRKAGAEGRRIFVCGNGGNSANAAHFATDLGKGASEAVPRPFKVLSLADNVSWMTAIGNDYTFDDVFARQLANHAEQGDVLILSSVSGNSPNLVAAAHFARDRGLVTVAMVGGKRGALASLADYLIVVDDTHYGRVEDVQMTILHMITYAIRERPMG